MSSVRIPARQYVAPLNARAGARPVGGVLASRETVRLVAAAGRLAIVVTGVLVPAAASTRLDAEGLLAIAAVAGIWVVMLRATSSAFDGLLGTWTASAIAAGLALATTSVLHPLLSDYHVSSTALVVTAAGIVLSTGTWESAVRRTGARRRRVLVVGPCDTSALIASELHGSADFDVVGRVGEAGGLQGDSVPLSGTMASLAAVVEAQAPDLLVLADERMYGDALDRLLVEPTSRVRVVGLHGFFEHALGRVPVTHLSPAWFMSLVHLRQPVYGRWTKRVFDIAAAMVGLLLALPIMAVLALIVSRSPGSVLYRQTRLGERGRPFTIFKFRTMVSDAERDGPCFACDDDPRLIPGGALLRRTHLDELPQLWNVLRGEMSIVGPRPERPEVASSLEEDVPFWNRRLLVKPGVTGWAQVRCGYIDDCERMADKLAYDLWYLRNQSLLVDLAICIRTVGQQLGSLRPSLSASKGVVR